MMKVVSCVLMTGLITVFMVGCKPKEESKPAAEAVKEAVTEAQPAMEKKAAEAQPAKAQPPKDHPAH